MKTKTPELVRILIEWFPFNYGRGEDDPVFVKEVEVIEFARVTPNRLIVHYGDGRVKKQLKRFLWSSRTKRYRNLNEVPAPKKKWFEYYGSHNRCSRTQLKFTLLT